MLHINRAERADALVGALRDRLAVPPDDPVAVEVVCVPTRGMERWLTQRLSGSLGASPGRRDGVCANVDFPPPRRLLGAAGATASGISPEAEPWLPERAVCPLLELVDDSLPIAAHLSGARRFGALRHVAELFDRYGLHRPEIVRAWAAGEDPHWQGGVWRGRWGRGGGARARAGQPRPARLPGPGVRAPAGRAGAARPPAAALAVRPHQPARGR